MILILISLQAGISGNYEATNLFSQTFCHYLSITQSRYSNYHEENRRTLFKAYGIRFIVEVRGEGRKFHILPTMLNIGSGLALLGLVILKKKL